MDNNEALNRIEDLIEICEAYQLVEPLERLNMMRDTMTDPLKIMIVGENKSGKSTLLNALVGRNVADVDDIPKTWCINAYIKTEETPFAELIYPDKKERVSIEKATEIRDKIASGKKGTDNCYEPWADLVEIRWHVDINWPESNMMIIDTPGFNQVRADTGYGEIRVDGINGIQFRARDGFENYYQKADIVLWCFHYKGSNDSEVEKKLNAVKDQKKKIYGIITQLDREATEGRREKSFQRNNNHYKKYLTECLRSSLPFINGNETEKDRQDKERMRENTVTGIKACISYLLTDSRKKDEIRRQNTGNAIKLMEKLISEYLQAYLVLYWGNHNIYKTNRDRVLETAEEACRLVLNNISGKWMRFEDVLLNENWIAYAWERAGGNLTRMQELIVEKTDEYSRLYNCQDDLDFLYTQLGSILEHGRDSLHWESVRLLKNGEINTEKEKGNYSFKASMGEKAEGAIHLEGLGIAYELFGKISDIIPLRGLSEVIGGLYKNKAVTNALNACEAYIREKREFYLQTANRMTADAFNEYDTFLRTEYKKQTGIAPEETIDAVLKIEKLKTKRRMFYKPVGFYPIYDKDHHVEFLQSEYYCKSTDYAQNDLNNALEECLKYGIFPLFKKRELEAEAIFSDAFKTYTGTAAVKTPVIPFADMTVKKDRSMIFGYVPVYGIQWGSLQETFEKKYRERQIAYLDTCRMILKTEKKKAEHAVLSRIESNLEKKLSGSIERFRRPWIMQMEGDINWCVERGMYQKICENVDFVTYYSKIYQYWYGRDSMLEMLIQYKIKHNLEELISGMEYSYVDTDGKLFGRDLVSTAEAVFEKSLKQMETICEPEKEKWDGYINTIYRGVYTRFRIRLDDMELQIKSNRIDAKKLTAYLKGDISRTDIGPEAIIQWSGGRSIEERLREEVRIETEKMIRSSVAERKERTDGNVRA